MSSSRPPRKRRKRVKIKLFKKEGNQKNGVDRAKKIGRKGKKIYISQRNSGKILS